MAKEDIRRLAESEIHKLKKSAQSGFGLIDNFVFI